MEPFDFAVGLGPVRPDADMVDVNCFEGVTEDSGGVSGSVEFLTVVKGFVAGHAGVGTGGVSERSATPFLTRSSLRLAVRAWEIDRRAARISGGIW